MDSIHLFLLTLNSFNSTLLKDVDQNYQTWSVQKITQRGMKMEVVTSTQRSSVSGIIGSMRM